MNYQLHCYWKWKVILNTKKIGEMGIPNLVDSKYVWQWPIHVYCASLMTVPELQTQKYQNCPWSNIFNITLTWQRMNSTMLKEQKYDLLTYRTNTEPNNALLIIAKGQMNLFQNTRDWTSTTEDLRSAFSSLRIVDQL